MVPNPEGAPGYHDLFVDYGGEKVTVEWNDSVWTNHLNKHPELRSKENASQLLAAALAEPGVVMQGVRLGGTEETRIYYQEIRRHQHFITALKAVCGVRHGTVYVKTVFEVSAEAGNMVKERQYPEEFKELWKEPTTNIY